MAIDYWTGTGNWNTTPGNWSAGVPTSSTDAAIQTASTNNLTTSGVAKSLVVVYNGSLNMFAGATLNVTQQTSVYGALNLTDTGGGTTATIGGALGIYGQVNLGNGALAANTTLTAASLILPGSSPGYAFPGELNITGNFGVGSAVQAKVAITSAIPTTLAGIVRLTGNANLSLATTGITTIAATGTLDLRGTQAKVTIGAANTGLNALTLNSGRVYLTGNSFYGGAITLTTTSQFTNYGTFLVDALNYGDGGSAITIGGLLTNTGQTTVGNTGLLANTTLAATSLTNNGDLVVQGNSANTFQATLNITGSNSATAAGSTRVSGNAALQLVSGITSTAANSTLEIDGSGARISIGAAATSTALTSFATNYGTFRLRGNSGFGTGGASVTTNVAFANNATVEIDANSFDGGSTFTINGSLTNLGTMNVGNSLLGANTNVSATGFSNFGTLNLQGQVGGSPGFQTTLNITGAGSSTATGTTRVGGNADLAVTTAITAISQASTIEIDGSLARISLGLGSTNSALTGLASNSGQLALRGNSGFGSGGASVTTSVAYNNTGHTNIDNNSFDGGSTFTIGGSLTNSGTMTIGNGLLSGNTTVSATGLNNTGILSLQGDNAASPVYLATLAITGASSSNLTGSVRVGGNADLQLVTGITSILGGSALELDGQYARVSIGAGSTNTALTNLATNAGALRLRGNGSGAPGGVSLTTTPALTNSGNLFVDEGTFEGGSTFTIGGNLTNSGQTFIGNPYLNSSTAVTATGLSNSYLVLQGGYQAASTNQATLAITVGNSSNSTGYTRIGGNADLQLVNGIKAVIAGAWLEIDGAKARVSLGAGATNNALTGFVNNAGTFVMRGNTGFGDGGSTLNVTTGVFINSGDVFIDGYGSYDGGSTANFAGIANSGRLFIGNSYMTAATNVTTTTFLNNGRLELQGGFQASGTNLATFTVNSTSPANVTGYIRVGGDANLALTTKITAVLKGGTLELDGAKARISRIGGSSTTNSGLDTFANNYGTFVLRGNSGFGAGGVSLTTVGTAFTNLGSFQMDSNSFDGASVFTVGGGFINSGTATIGNTLNFSGTATVMTAQSLPNYGTIELYGNATNPTVLNITSAQNYGTINIRVDTKIDAGAGAFINRSGTVTVDGTLLAGSLSVAGGTVDFNSNVGNGNSPTTLSITTGGTLNFDGSVDSTKTVTFTGNNAGILSLSAPGTFAGKISGFNSTDYIDLIGINATGLSYAGTTSSGLLTVTGASGTIATLAFTGNYTTASFGLLADGHGGTYIT